MRCRRASRTAGQSSSTTRVPGGVPVLPVTHQHVLAVDPLELRRKTGEGRAGALVEGVCLELDSPAAEHVERVLELQELRLGVRPRSPGRRGKPRPADLEAPVLGTEGEVASRADRRAGLAETVANASSRPASVPEPRADVIQPPTRRGSAAAESAATARLGVARCRVEVVAVPVRRAAPTVRCRPRSSVSSIAPCASAQYTWVMPIYEYACMECEDHFDELVRSEDQVITCPSCETSDVLEADLRRSPCTARR